MKHSNASGGIGKIPVLTVVFLLALLMICTMANARTRSMKAPPPEKLDAIIIGDRVLDIAYNLDVLPLAMSVRGSLWHFPVRSRSGARFLVVRTIPL